MKLRVFEAWLIAGLASASLPMGSAALAQVAAGPTIGPWPTTTMRPPLPPKPVEAAPASQAPAPVAPIRRAEPEESEPQSAMITPPEPEHQIEPAAPQDGVLEPQEPQPVVDGLDPNVVDSREPEDAQAFAPREPAAGYDPSQFTIEPDPILDARPAIFARLDPYAPTGIRVGTFTLYPEAEVNGAAFTNLLRSSAPRRGDAALEVRPAVRLISNWGVHALEAGARGLASFHDALPSEDDRAWAVDARARLDITRRTNVEAAFAHEVSQETRGTINARANLGGRTDVAIDRAAAALNHRFNRLSLQLRGAIVERDFGAAEDAGTVTLANRDRDQTQHELALRASWSFKPQLALFGEIAGDERRFGAPSASDNIRRDSSGERYRAGISFGEASQIVRGEVAIGALRQRFDDGRLPEISGVIVDANVAWRITGLTSLLVTARSDIGESTVAGSGGAIVRSAGAEVRHAFRRNLVGSAGVRLTRADYAGLDLVEQDMTTSAGLEYFLSREVTLFGRYAHIDFNTTSPGSDYTADEVRVGVRLRR